MSGMDQDREQLREIAAELEGPRNRLFEKLKPLAMAREIGRENSEPAPL